jgi:phosphosulfolactate phosphohydrolase-like enzyme
MSSQLCVCCVVGYSRKGLVGVQAASAGGLLVGALLNRHAAATCLCGTNEIRVTFIVKSSRRNLRMTANDTVPLTL